MTAEVDLVLVDPPSGKRLWQARWPARPVAAGPTGSVALGYPIAVRTLLGSMIARLARGSGTADLETTN